MIPFIEIFLKDIDPLINAQINKLSTENQRSITPFQKAKYTKEILFQIKILILELAFEEVKIKKTDLDTQMRNVNFHIQGLIDLLDLMDPFLKTHKEFEKYHLNLDKLSTDLRKFSKAFGLDNINNFLEIKDKGRKSIQNNKSIVNFTVSLSEIYTDITKKSPSIYSEPRVSTGSGYGNFHDFFELCYPQSFLRRIITYSPISPATIKRILQNHKKNKKIKDYKNSKRHLTSLKAEYYYFKYPKVDKVFLDESIARINNVREIYKKLRVYDTGLKKIPEAYQQLIYFFELGGMVPKANNINKENVNLFIEVFNKWAEFMKLHEKKTKEKQSLSKKNKDLNSIIGKNKKRKRAQ